MFDNEQKLANGYKVTNYGCRWEPVCDMNGPWYDSWNGNNRVN